MASGMMTVRESPNISGWSIENGYNIESNEYPYRVWNSGRYTGLYVSLTIHEDELEYVCPHTSLGYKVILTAPGDALEMSRNVLEVSLAEYSLISIKPKLISTSEG